MEPASTNNYSSDFKIKSAIAVKTPINSIKEVEDISFDVEMERRFKELEEGKGITLTLEQMLDGARSSHKKRIETGK